MQIVRMLIGRTLTVFAILALTFLLLHTVPGGPFDSDRGLPPEIENNLYQKYGLIKRGEKPFLVWVVQDAAAYAKRLAHGELGPSLKYVDRDVSDIIAQALPPSLLLGSFAFTCALILAIISAIGLSATSGRFHDALTIISSFFVAMPGFMKAILLITFFSLQLKLLPPALWGGWSHRILPAATLAIGPYFLMTEFLYTEMRKEQLKDYVRTALAKGLKTSVILVRHVLRNSLNPLLALLGPIATSFVTGSFIVETVFSIPGMGRHFILAVIDRDYFLVMGLTLVFATILLVFNTTTDLIAQLIDPRQRQT